MGQVKTFLTRRRGGSKVHFTDAITYFYLLLGVVVMFGPVVWLILSSFKTAAEVVRFPPRLLPWRQETVVVEGYEEPLPLYEVTSEDGSTRVLAQVRRIGLEAQLIDPENPGEIIRVHINDRQPVESVSFGLENFGESMQRFDFLVYLRNSVVVTAAATLLTLLVAAPAFAQSPEKTTGEKASEPASTSSSASTQPPITIQHLRPQDQRGIGIFEPPKTDVVAYEGFKLDWGAAFTQQFQSLNHSNTAQPRLVNEVDANQLIDIGTVIVFGVGNSRLKHFLENARALLRHESQGLQRTAHRLAAHDVGNQPRLLRRDGGIH